MKNLGPLHRSAVGLGLFSMATCALAADNSAYEACMLEKLKSADDSMPISYIKEACLDDNPTYSAEVVASTEPGVDEATIQGRLKTEFRNRQRDYIITPHEPNYVLPYTHNAHPNDEPFLDDPGIDPDAHVKEDEIMVQISIKFPLAIDLWDSNTDLMVAYTNRAWWQAYNGDVSRPFRETDYEPEIFLRHYNFNESADKWYVPEVFDFGFVHQSNGRDDPLSRSWNRIFATGYFQLTENLSLGLETWYRIPESKSDDDNPGIYRYRGYGDARFVYTYGKSTFSWLARPGTEKFSNELTWTYPITDHIRLMAYYYNGYAEDLIDYNYKSERFGLGFSISDYLAKP